ncbi:MAG: alpha/beta fold hydrolase [Clostridia bacterium]
MHATSSGLRIAYRRLGKPGDVPLLIVHGLSYTSADWLSVAERLGNEREVICIDMRGFGESDWSPAKDYSVPAMAGDIVAVLDHAGVPRAALAGHSMGGRSATYAAARNAGRVAGLVLIDYSPENAPAGTMRTAKNVVNNPERFRRDPFFREQFKRLLETGERPKQGVDMWQVIGEVSCPILSLRGARSDMYMPETVAKMQAANPRLKVVEVDAGHNIAGDNPAAFVKEMNSFLATLERATA